MVAYGIVDNSSGLALMPRGQSEYSALPRREIRWGVFCRPGHVVRSYLKDGRALEVELPSPEVVRGEKTIWGVTSPQGHTNLSPALFRRSPSDSDWSWQIAFLAAVLYHEKLHFEQYTDPARANLDFDALEIDCREDNGLRFRKDKRASARPCDEGESYFNLWGGKWA